MKRAQLVDYFDVWGNAEDGFEVNNLARVFSEITDRDFETTGQVIAFLRHAGFLGENAQIELIEIDWQDEGHIELTSGVDGCPLGRIELLDLEYETIVFLSTDRDFDGFNGFEGDEARSAFFDAGTSEMFDYLAQWDMGEPGEIRSGEPWGSGDHIYLRDDMVMSWNAGLGYASLCRVRG